ncbi:hypothetical protein Vadar_033732 [Vaccinium darrowii]|uniref:Uncharacterized protein n=1 Tax=Vaccinium darrowii TaxID=229202 RepID=A0ACB7YHS1_9ERIC|nr:hypothetical protein Vadar_033732 [Vaccinium darrowii]
MAERNEMDEMRVNMAAMQKFIEDIGNVIKTLVMLIPKNPSPRRAPLNNERTNQLNEEDWYEEELQPIRQNIEVPAAAPWPSPNVEQPAADKYKTLQDQIEELKRTIIRSKESGDSSQRGKRVYNGNTNSLYGSGKGNFTASSSNHVGNNNRTPEVNNINNQPPPSRRRMFSQLGVPLSTVYERLLRRGVLKHLDPMPTPNPLPPRYDATKYCAYHQTHGHPIDNWDGSDGGYGGCGGEWLRWRWAATNGGGGGGYASGDGGYGEEHPNSNQVHPSEKIDMAIFSNALSSPQPSWFTPKRLLGIFCVINLLNYVDRGAIASNGVNGSLGTCTQSGTCTSGTGIQQYPVIYRGDFNLNNFEDGVLSSAFMVGLLVASPIFVSLAKRLVGVGEASFISLAAPFIDDNAPVAQNTAMVYFVVCIHEVWGTKGEGLLLEEWGLSGNSYVQQKEGQHIYVCTSMSRSSIHRKRHAWLAIFYMCIPAGVAVGYVYGGLVGGYTNWRFAFFGETILMFPFAVLGFVMKPLQLKGFSPIESQKASTAVSEVKGYIAYNFVIGAYSYWGPKAGYNIYHMTDADLIFGGITIVCGILGTVTGGYVLDKMTATIPNAFKLLSAATLLGAVFCFAAFCFKSLYAFLAFFAIGELLIFATQDRKPIITFLFLVLSIICLHCVKPSMRPISMAMSTVSIHIFGDVPSSPLVGVLQDYVNWRETALVLCCFWQLAYGLSGSFFPVSIDLMKIVSLHTQTQNHTRRPRHRCLKRRLQEKQNLQMTKIPKRIPFLITYVTEKGTEAACVTYVTMFEGRRRYQLPKSSFIANHLFMFMIKEEDVRVGFFHGSSAKSKPLTNTLYE